MTRDPESLVDQVLEEMYGKARRDGSAPALTCGGRAWDQRDDVKATREQWKELEETFPEEAE